MGLGDMSPDNGGEKKKDKGKYTVISREEFESFLDDTGYGWERTKKNLTELVYACDEIVSHDLVELLVFSTIDKHTENSRKKGSDAIRTVLWHKKEDCPVGGRKKTLRIDTWRKNLKKKIESIADNEGELLEVCDKCNNIMVKKEGPYGEFLGCLSYPDCENIENIN